MKQYPNLISAEVVKDSKAPTGERITTFKLVMPRYILAEFNTHRLFSRNSASSRAIPLKKMIQQVKKTPFIPMAFQKDHSGMQGIEYITDADALEYVKYRWLQGRDAMAQLAEALNSGENSNGKIDNKVTKQLCNRLLEPFLYHTVLVTATEWDNFFELRCPRYSFKSNVTGEETIHKSKKDLLSIYKDTNMDYATEVEWLQCNKGQGEIHIMDLAEKMWDAMNESTPKELKEGEWHIPFGDNFDEDEIYQTIKNHNPSGTYEFPDQWYKYDELKVKIATARCARISYETLGDNPKIDYEADIKLHDKLKGDGHMSVFEHCARVMSIEEYVSHVKGTLYVNNYSSDRESVEYKEAYLTDPDLGWSRNFKGFIQYRELVEQL